MEPPILETRPCLFQRKKDLSFDDLAGPTARTAKQINKIILSRTQNIKTVFTSRLWQHQSLHTFDQISDIQRCLLASQLFLDLARPNNCPVSLVNLHKRPEALARYYVTSYCQAEWVKKLKQTIELQQSYLPPWSIQSPNCRQKELLYGCIQIPTVNFLDFFRVAKQ